MSFNVCSIPNCWVRYADGAVLHCFPNPNTDLERFQVWITNIGGELITLDQNYIFKNKRICDKHFERIYYGSKNRLLKTAVPTLYLPGKASSLDLSTAQELPKSVQMTSHRDVPFETAPSTSKFNNLTVNVAQSRKSDINNGLTPKELKLHNTIVNLKKEVHKTRVMNKSYKHRLNLAIKTAKNESINHINKKLTEAGKLMIEMQIKQAGKKAKGRRFTIKQKILALSLYKHSPKAYRFLSNIFVLPQQKTLNMLLQNVALKPGINNFLFAHLKKKVERLPEPHKYCVLIFDEMYITPHIKYDCKSDEIIGFTDNGQTKTEEFCDHALVFMVRGVIKKYKQPVAFLFCNSSMKRWDLALQIKNIIKHVQDTGLKVIGTVCDQAAKNVSALNIILNETREKYLREGKEWKGGFFESNLFKIVPLYDPPHLMKGIRNNLLKKDLKYILKGKECTAKWQHIIDLYKRGPGYNGVRLVPKLTAKHVFPNLIPKMKVKNCTQVFSRSVGVALGFMADVGKLPEDSKETADIILFFDNIFDSVNCSSSKIKGGKILRTAVTPLSPHHKLWRDSLPILKSMRFVDTNGKTLTVPSLTSWVKTIEGFKAILKDLNRLGLRSILLRNFNQDPIENFFGAIRSHGGQNTMPNAAAFQGAYKTLIINNITSTHSVGANCERDKNSSLLNSLESFFNSELEAPNRIDSEIIIEEEHLFIEPINVETFIKSKRHVDQEKCAALAYCSGWLLVKARNIYKNCLTCKKDLESDKVEDYHKYIKISEYSDKSWLCYPTKEAFNFFVQSENIIQIILKKYSNKRNLIEYIKLIYSIHLSMSFISCRLHNENVIKFIIQKSAIFHIFTWCKIVNKILIGKELNYDLNDGMQLRAFLYKQRQQQKIVSVKK